MVISAEVARLEEFPFEHALMKWKAEKSHRILSMAYQSWTVSNFVPLLPTVLIGPSFSAEGARNFPRQNPGINTHKKIELSI